MGRITRHRISSRLSSTSPSRSLKSSTYLYAPPPVAQHGSQHGEARVAAIELGRHAGPRLLPPATHPPCSAKPNQCAPLTSPSHIPPAVPLPVPLRPRRLLEAWTHPPNTWLGAAGTQAPP